MTAFSGGGVKRVVLVNKVWHVFTKGVAILNCYSVGMNVLSRKGGNSDG